MHKLHIYTIYDILYILYILTNLDIFGLKSDARQPLWRREQRADFANGFPTGNVSAYISNLKVEQPMSFFVQILQNIRYIFPFFLSTFNVQLKSERMEIAGEKLSMRMAEK